jgi:hypothetical protein
VSAAALGLSRDGEAPGDKTPLLLRCLALPSLTTTSTWAEPANTVQEPSQLFSTAARTRCQSDVHKQPCKLSPVMAKLLQRQQETRWGHGPSWVQVSYLWSGDMHLALIDCCIIRNC